MIEEFSAKICESRHASHATGLVCSQHRDETPQRCALHRGTAPDGTVLSWLDTRGDLFDVEGVSIVWASPDLSPSECPCDEPWWMEGQFV